MGFKVGDKVVIVDPKPGCSACDDCFNRFIGLVGEVEEAGVSGTGIDMVKLSEVASILTCNHQLIPMWKKGDKAKVVAQCCKSCLGKPTVSFQADEPVEIQDVGDQSCVVRYNGDKSDFPMYWMYCFCMLRPLESEPPKSCVCETQVLWCRGCQCGQIQRERAAKEGTR